MMIGPFADVVTGATGLIGRWLLLERTRADRRVLALVRRPDERLPELRRWIDRHGEDGSLLHTAPLDLARPDLGLDERGERALDEAEVVYHLAADFRFGLSRPQAHQANIAAPLHLIDRLSGRTDLRRFIHISGYRTEGSPARALDIHDPRALSRFHRRHGAYEASKVEAHTRVTDACRAHSVPFTIVSPSTVIGDSATGETTQLTGLGETILDLYRGRMPALPGGRDLFLPVVTVDLLARILHLLPDDATSEGDHLLLLDPDTPNLHELLGLAAATLQVPLPRTSVPMWLLRALPPSLTGIDREGLSFLSTDRYNTAPMQAFLQRHHLELPDVSTALAQWFRYLPSLS